MLPCAYFAAEPPPPCILDVPVYDPHGNRLPFNVVGLTVEVEGSKTELLGKEIDGIRITSKGDRVFFSSARIIGTGPIEVTLESSKRDLIKTKVYIAACRLRRSLFYGQSDLGYDVTSVFIRGRFSGCRFTGDWWVRAMAMFGGHLGSALEDGYVESDGAFWLYVGATGVRRLLVIGKGKQPIRVVGFDVTVGKEHDIGNIDLSGSCPQ